MRSMYNKIVIPTYIGILVICGGLLFMGSPGFYVSTLDTIHNEMGARDVIQVTLKVYGVPIMSAVDTIDAQGPANPVILDRIKY